MDLLLQNLRALRLSKGWKQEDLATRLEMSVPAFSKFENGKTEIKLSRLEQISHIFSIPVVKLLQYNYEDILRYTAKEELINQKLDAHVTHVFHLQKTIIELYCEIEDFDN
jgi:transcriptional regulator with XRE-family HTH domain